MNVYLEAPNRVPFEKMGWENTVFLAGSISGARDWQIEAKDRLLPYLNVINPRRANYSSLDPNIEREQIVWEHEMLRFSDKTLFWFSPETLAPITLYELGKMLALSKYQPWRRIYIGIDPDYKRKNDVLIQTQLMDPQLAKKIKFNLGELLDLIIMEN